MAGLIPWWLTGWDAKDTWAALRVLGAVLVAAGLVVLVQAFVRFVVEGVGTPAPVAPTEHLVVGGLYRYVRNPMYVAVAAIIVGQALVLGRPALLLYAAAFVAVTATFVRLYEEPALRQRFGAEYEAYRRAVPGWWPRHAWRPGAPTSRPSLRAPEAVLRRADVLAQPAHERRGGVELLADRAPGLRAVQPRAERVAAGHGQALAAQQVQPRVIGRVAARGAHERRARRAPAPPSARARSPASAAPPCARRRSRGGCGRAGRAPGGRGPPATSRPSSDSST